MFRIALTSLVAALLALQVPGAFAAPKNGQKFTDWTARCEARKDGAGEACFIVQNLLLKSQNKPLLNVAVGYLAAGDQPAAFFTLPLGVSLPGGLSLTVDDGKPMRLRYERCDVTGCLAPLALSEPLVKSLKGGRWARVAYFDPNRREISVPVSLLGFTAGFNALTP